MEYMKLFDGSRLLTPSIEPHFSDINLKVLGCILSHGYMCTEFLPTRVALPALMAMFLGPTVNIGPEVFIEVFLDYISQVDRCIVNEALEISGPTFSDTQKDRLIDILGMYACRQVLTPEKLRETLLQVSKYIFSI